MSESSLYVFENSRRKIFGLVWSKDWLDAELTIEAALGGAATTSKFLFRGVNASRLTNVLVSGIDVEPSTAAMWATPDLSKALEYGEYETQDSKVILAIRQESVQRSFRRMKSSNITGIEETQRVYPNRIDRGDGTVWLTRFSPTQGNVGGAYEQSFGYWIPEDANDYLEAILLLGRSLEEVRLMYLEADVRVKSGLLNAEDYTLEMKSRIREQLLGFIRKSK